MLHDVPLEFVHEFAVHVNDLAAACTFQMKMSVASVIAVDQLIHSTLAAVRQEFFYFAVLHHAVKTAVNCRLADLISLVHEIQVNIISRDAYFRIEPKILSDGLLLTCAVILFAFVVFQNDHLQAIKIKMIIIFKFALLLYHVF